MGTGAAQLADLLRRADGDAAAKKAGDLGAAAIVPPTRLPGAGRFAVLRDPQGATFAIYKMPGA